MVAAYQSFAHRSEGVGGNIVVTKPTGTVDGDLLICIAFSLGGAANPITPPAGWTQHAATLDAGAKLLTKVASGEGASYTFTQNALQTGQVLIVRVNGQAASTPIDAASGVQGTGNLVIPTLTSAGANRLLLQLVVKGNNTTFTGPGSQTERFDAISTSSGFVSAGGDETVGSGATGSRTWTPAAGAAAGVGYMLAIRGSSQTLTVSGFTPAVTFGTPSLRQTRTVTGFAPAVSFGGVSLRQTRTVSGFTPNVVFGTPVLVSEVNPSGFTPTVVFGTPVLGQRVDVDGFTVPVVFGSPTVILDNVLPVSGFTPAIVFGAPDVDRQPFVTATVYDHETGNPLGAGATVQLFDVNGTLLDTTTTDVNGVYWFYLPFGFTDNVFTVVRTTVGLTDYQGVSEICSVST